MKSRGLGDSIEKFTKATGIKKVVEKASEVTGRPCGCGERRDTLNRLFLTRKIVNFAIWHTKNYKQKEQ